MFIECFNCGFRSAAKTDSLDGLCHRCDELYEMKDGRMTLRKGSRCTPCTGDGNCIDCPGKNGGFVVDGCRFRRNEIGQYEEDVSSYCPSPQPNPKELDSSHKVPVSLFPATAVIAGAFVMNLGNQMPGRTPLNWRDKPVRNTSYVSAVMRHLGKYMDGEDNDPDLSERSGQDVSHLWAALSSLAIMIDAEECGKLLDARPPKGGAAKMLDRLTKEKKETK